MKNKTGAQVSGRVGALWREGLLVGLVLVAASFLTRATAILAVGFIATSLTLAVMASHNRKPRSVLDSAPVQSGAPAKPATPAAPVAPAKPAQPAAPLGR